MKIPRWDLFCDGWAHQPETVVATVERTISIDGGGEYIVDLCESCNLVIDQIAQMLAERAAPASARRTVPKLTGWSPERPYRVGDRAVTMKEAVDERFQRTCPVCWTEYDDRERLRNHLWREHGKRFRDIPRFSKRGTTGTPRKGVDFESEFMRTCPECGAVHSQRRIMADHLRKKHQKSVKGYDWTQA